MQRAFPWKLLAGLATILAVRAPVQGQTAMDSLLMRPVVRCEDVSTNGRAMFLAHVAAGHLDSAELVLQHWRRLCPATESWQRSKLLLLMARPALVDTAIPDGIAGLLAEYRYLAKLPIGTVEKHSVELAQHLAFTRAWAAQLKDTFSPGMVEHGLAEFYGPDPDKLLPALGAGQYPGSRLQEEYWAELQPVLDMAEFHFAIFGGVWLPSGGLSVLGPRPGLGFQTGAKKKRMNWDLTFAGHSGPASNSYQARRPELSDTLEWTDHFSGLHASLDFGYDLVQAGKHELQAVGGFGYDSFDVFPSDTDPDTDDVWSAGTMDLSFGTGYRYYFLSNTYLGAQLKYHLTDYSRNHVVDIRGNPITFRILVGSLINLSKRANLNWYQYRDRQRHRFTGS